ncbi:hypothetical protein NL676_002827 [Syzygium grande]|nr:hypothetical protein NL676_002827 [Syzygium grande]
MTDAGTCDATANVCKDPCISGELHCSYSILLNLLMRSTPMDIAIAVSINNKYSKQAIERSGSPFEEALDSLMNNLQRHIPLTPYSRSKPRRKRQEPAEANFVFASRLRPFDEAPM